MDFPPGKIRTIFMTAIIEFGVGVVLIAFVLYLYTCGIE